MLPDPFIGVLLWIPILSLLAYCPFLCYLDLKCREVEHIYWLPLLIVNVPIWSFLYCSGTYPWYAFIISLLLCGIFYTVMRFGIIGGADMLFLWWISLFFVYNMIPYDHGLMAFPFMMFLLTTLAITGIIIGVYNFVKRWELSFKYPDGIPMMLPICAALILTVMYG